MGSGITKTNEVMSTEKTVKILRELNEKLKDEIVNLEKMISKLLHILNVNKINIS